MRESGIDVAVGGWRTLAVPAATQPAELDRLTAALRTVTQEPEARAALTAAGILPSWLAPTEAWRAIQAEFAAAGALFAQLGLSVRKEMLGLRTE